MLKFAVRAITDFLLDNELTVYLCVFDREAYSFSKKLFADIREYIDDTYAEDAKTDVRSRRMRRELGNWRSTAFAVLYQCLLAYGVALMIYAFGSIILGTEVGTGSLIAAVVALVILAYFMLMKDPFHQNGGKAIGDSQ